MNNQPIQYKYFTLISMLSITMMIIAMLFTYRVIQIGVDAYNLVFSHNLNLLVGFSISFVISDLVNAYAINKWRILFKGKYFWLRSIGSSAIGETFFRIFAAGLMYSSILSYLEFIKVVSFTWMIKMCIAIIASYPATIAVEVLKKMEGITQIDNLEFKPFSFQD